MVFLVFRMDLIKIALFNFPTAVSADPLGNIYLADSGNSTIRKISKDGTVSTLAGNPHQKGSIDGNGMNALFSFPDGVAVDENFNVYVCDSDNHNIRKITAQGDVTTIAGIAGVEGHVDGYGKEARFHLPTGICEFKGVLYVSDRFNHIIRRITPDGYVKTIAGIPGISGYHDDIGPKSMFNFPSGIAHDKRGNIYVADRGNHSIRKIDTNGMVITLAGDPNKGWSDGIGKNAQFLYPECVAVDSNTQEVFVADFGNHVIRKISIKNQQVITVAGSPGKDGSIDGIAKMALFNSPNGVAVDIFGNILVTEYRNHTVRKLIHIYWSPSTHFQFPRNIRDQIRVLITLACIDSSFKPKHPQSSLYMLPKELLFRIFDFLVEN